MRAFFLGLSIGITFVMGLFLFVPGEGTVSYRQGYKQGQVDALNGHVRFHLVVKPDSSRIWEENK